jgi:hypothetical protein
MLVLLIPYAVLGLIGGWIAAHKGYPPVWGIIAGVAFGPLALVVAACLPQTAEARDRARAQAQTEHDLAISRQLQPCPRCGRENSVVTRICPQCDYRFERA